MKRLVLQSFGYGDDKVQALPRYLVVVHIRSRPPGGGFCEGKGFGPRHRILLTSGQYLTHGLCSLST